MSPKGKAAKKRVRCGVWKICILPRPCLEEQTFLLFVSQVAGTLFKIGYFFLRFVTTLITVLYLCIWYGHSHADHILIFIFTFVNHKPAFKIQFIILACNYATGILTPFLLLLSFLTPYLIGDPSPYGHYFIDNNSCANIHHILNLCPFL